MSESAAVTVKVEGGAVAVFPAGLETRVELHPGEQATFEGERIVIEPAMITWRKETNDQ